jgi:hypothetical protein
MTLGITPPLIDYLENGVTLLHAIPFQFQTGLEIDCSRISGGVETPLVRGADFTVTGGGGGTGTVTKSNGGAVGQTFRIRRVTTRAQETDLLAHDPFPPDDVELSLDRVAAVNQEQEVEVTLLEGRTIHVPPGDTIATLPGPPSARANLYMKFYNDGREIQLLTVNAVATDLAIPLAPLLGTVSKGDPGSAGEGYPTRAAMALAGNAASNRDDAYLCETLREGKFVFIVPLPGQEAAFAALVAADPQQGVYVARQGDATGLTGAWVRKWDGAELDVRWFGAVLDNFTIDYVAVQAAVNLSYAMRALPTVGAGIRPGFGAGAGPDVRVPGLAFMGVNTLTLSHTFNLRGSNVGVPASQFSGMRWPQDVTGILNTGRAGIFGLALLGAFGITTTTEGEYHAVKATQVFPYGDLNIWNWQGDGFNLDCTGGNNVNGVVGGRVWCASCRNAYWNKAGGDNSAGAHQFWNVESCREWAIKEETFLGVGHYSHEVANCGVTQYNDGLTIGCSVVSQGGNRYCAIIGQEVWCRTHAPTGTTLDNQGWAYMGPGGPAPLAGMLAWFNNILVRAGGSYTAQNPNGPTNFVNCYAETGQGLAQLTGAALSSGGNLGQAIWKGNASVLGAPGLLASFRGLTVGPPVLVNRAYLGTDETVSVSLGEWETNLKSVVTLEASVTSPLKWRMFRVLGTDLLLAEYGGQGIYQGTVITGPGTTFQGGSGVAQSGAFVCGGANFYTGNSVAGARRVTNWAGTPTAFSWGKADVAFDAVVAPGGKVGNVCTTAGVAGSTAVFKPFGPVDA